MGLAVGAHQARPVHPQHHVELLEGHVVDQLVIAPLEEGGVHGEHGDHPLLGKARRHGHPVALGDGHVEEPVRELPGKGGQAGAVRHGGGDGADAAVLRGAGDQRPAEHGGEVVSPALFQKARLRVKGAHPVELVRVLLREGVALALHRLDVDHHRAPQLPGPGQHVDQPVQVVAVDGAQVGETHVLEQGAAGPQGLFQGGLDLVVEPVEPVLRGVWAKESPVPLLEMIIGGLGPDLAQVAVHRPHIGVDGHAVVVEKDDQGLAGGAGVVEPLVGKASGEGPIPDQCQDGVVFML